MLIDRQPSGRAAQPCPIGHMPSSACDRMASSSLASRLLLLVVLVGGSRFLCLDSWKFPASGFQNNQMPKTCQNRKLTRQICLQGPH